MNKFLSLKSRFKNLLKKLSGCGEIGRRARFRS